MHVHGDPLEDATDPRATTIDEWRERGWTGTFRVRDDATLECSQCQGSYPPGEVRVDHVGRHEGISNPDDEELLLALTCRSCGHRGTVTLGYGPYASEAEAEVARRLVDRPR